MRVLSANMLTVLFLCPFTYVMYTWTGLERRLDRYKLGFHKTEAVFVRRSHALDISPKTFRTLLALPVAKPFYFGDRISFNNHSDAGLKLDIFRKDKQYNNVKYASSKFSEAILDGIFWSERLEALLPAAFTDEHARAWRDRVRGYKIVSLKPGCGRVSNRLAVFADGTKACVRYGINAEQVQGETLSYYLASLFGISNLPPLTISKLNPEGEQWMAVKEEINTLQWTVKTIVSLTEWISNLTCVVTPVPLRHGDTGLHPFREDLQNMTVGELLEMMEWTDLILFDFITANFDRLVSNLFSLQWDSRVMERDISNLHKTPGGHLVFIDNEAGLVHGYRVLHMWDKYHNTLLGSLCLFRKKTALRVMELHRLRNTRALLLEIYKDNEPLAPELGFFSDEHSRILQERIDILYKHILDCKGKYSVL